MAAATVAARRKDRNVISPTGAAGGRREMSSHISFHCVKYWFKIIGSTASFKDWAYIWPLCLSHNASRPDRSISPESLRLSRELFLLFLILSLAYKYKHGIAIAISRLTTVEIKGLYATLKAILKDEETKVLPLNPEKNVVCTLTGNFEYWYKMYNDIATKAPAPISSPEDATEKAYTHMKEISHEDLEDYKQKYRQELQFGTIIAGCKQGLQLHCLRLDKENNVAKPELNVGALGSGARYAMWVLLDGHPFDSYGETKDLTEQEAIDLAMKAAFCATVFDPFSGGYIRVYLMDETNEDGCREVACENPLDVYYANYNLYDMDECTIFLLYSTKIKPYFAEDELNGLMGALWPTWENKKDHIYANHLVAMKRDFYVHRIVMSSREVAKKAYDLINRELAPQRDPVALGGEFLACEIELDPDDYITIYVEKSSKNLLQIIHDLETPDNLDYS